MAVITAADASAVRVGGAVTRSRSTQQIQAPVQPEFQALISAVGGVIVPGNAAESVQEALPAMQLEAAISVNVVKPAGISQGEVARESTVGGGYC